MISPALVPVCLTYDPQLVDFSQRSHFWFAKGEKIPLPAQDVWLVCQGVVKLNMLYADGQEVLLGIAGAPILFGACLTSMLAYQATALAEVELVQFSLPEIEASEFLQQHLLASVRWQLRQTEALLAITGLRRIRDRLLHLLRLLQQQISQPVAQGYRLDIHLTHGDLASAIGTSRVTVTRQLTQLRQQGLILFDSQRRLIVTHQLLDQIFD